MLLSFCAACITCLEAYDIDDDAAIVLATLFADTVRNAERTTFTASKLRSRDRVMAPTFCRLGAVSAHSYNHIEGDYTEWAPDCKFRQNVVRWRSQ